MLQRGHTSPDFAGQLQAELASARGAEIRPEADIETAARGLARQHPEFSAGTPMWLWQKLTILGLVGSLVIAGVVAPRATLALLMAMLALPFLCVMILRAMALWIVAAGSRPPAVQPANPVARWPVYSVLVPLYKEANVVPGLVAALRAIDYPRDRLEIFLIAESTDPETRAAIKKVALPDHMKLIIVPDGQPRTKPRALNFALQSASGDYVVVYDAEDTPDPGQLKAAVQLLERPGTPIGCIQARLGIDNTNDNWLTRQFTIEYAALFHAILPALERGGLPVPLGGTSNHFPRAVLQRIGGWDAYNVTEDADLGFRLARMGYEVKILNSTTSEEAPADYEAWFKQRTRWLKGWMQTYLVHMRQPRRLWRDLGTKRFAGFQVLMGGLILSALVHPWFYILATADFIHGYGFSSGGTTAGLALWWLGVVNLIAGYLTAVALGMAAARQVHGNRLALYAALMPIYWLAISLAAYRALWQLSQSPYLWEKTQHRTRNAPGN